MGFQHFSIKAENVVLMGAFPNCEIKLCDMESARVIQEDESIREVIGTPDYVGTSSYLQCAMDDLYAIFFSFLYCGGV